MDSKLEIIGFYKIAVVVLDVMHILKMALALLSQRLTLWWILWHVSGGIVLLPTFSNTSIFQSPISSRVWILDFPIHPIAQNSSNRRSLSSKLLR
jgi:hypothetical protein